MRCTFGQKLRMEESQHLELKSSREVPLLEPLSIPFAHKKLRCSIREHLAKYIVAFLNGHCLMPQHEDVSYTIMFGIHDDGTVDGYFTTDEEKDQTIRIINSWLDRLTNQYFTRRIQWIPVLGIRKAKSLGIRAYVLSVSVTPYRQQMCLLDHAEQNYVFWLRTDNCCRKMTYQEIAMGYAHAINA